MIKAQIRRLEKQAKVIERERQEHLAVAAKLIARYGLSHSDWKRAVAMSSNNPKLARRQKRAVQLPAKYADDKGNTWSGRGRTPLWLVAAEKAGRKRGTFLLKT